MGRLAEMQSLVILIESSEEYTTAKGSRYITPTSPGFYTDILHQLNLFLKERRANIKPSTYRKSCALVNKVGHFFAGQSAAALPVGLFTNEVAKRFLNWVLSSISNESYNAHLQLLKSLFVEMQASEIIKINPFAGIKKIAGMSVAPLYQAAN